MHRCCIVYALVNGVCLIFTQSINHVFIKAHDRPHMPHKILN